MNITTYVRLTKNVHAEYRNFVFKTHTHTHTQSLYIYVLPFIYIFRHLLTYLLASTEQIWLPAVLTLNVHNS
jgi:hypothetical protein